MTSGNIFREGPNHFDIFMSAAYNNKTDARIPLNLYVRSSECVAIIELHSIQKIEWESFGISGTLAFTGKGIFRSKKTNRHLSNIAIEVNDYDPHGRDGTLIVTFEDGERIEYSPNKPRPFLS